MKYSITLVKITKNVSGPVSINFVSLASEPSLLVLRHDRCFGTSVVSARALLRHERCFGTIVASARWLLRHDGCFGTMVASARALLRHERCFGTSVSSPAGKYEALSNASQREVNKTSGTSLLSNLSPLLVSNISAGRETRVSQR